MMLEDVGGVFRVTRERIRQIEAKALAKIRLVLKRRGVTDAGFATGLSLAETLVLEGGTETALGQQQREAKGAGEAAKRSAEAFALDVFALRLEGVPLRDAWSLANGCPPAPRQGSSGMPKSNGMALETADAGKDDAIAKDTATLVREAEAANAALLSRREELRAELEIVEGALAGVRDASPRPGHEAGHRQTSPPAGRKPAKGKAKPTGSRTERVLGYIEANPGKRTGEIASATGLTSDSVAGALFALKKGGRVQSDGPKHAQTWALP